MHATAQHAMLAVEKRAVVSLGLIYAFRMLGLFMLLPVLALYAADFDGSSPLLIGLALGVYGLTQALLQIPFGWLSDRLGRVPVIIGGLILFGFGSLVAAGAATIWGVIAGRALQGSGAISSTVLALLSDLTREEQRSKAMALIGMSIGLTFAVALLLGPWCSAVFGVRSVFWLTAAMVVLGVLIVLFAVPSVQNSSRHDANSTPMTQFVWRAVSDPELMRLNGGIFFLHFSLTSLFVALPLLLRDVLQLQVAQHASVYLVVMGGGFAAMLPFLIYAERKQRVREVFLASVVLLALAAGMLSSAAATASGGVLVLSLFAFFMAFNFLEANLPSLVSRHVFPGGRGTAMGIYSSCQFFGAFLGGVAGGWMMQIGGSAQVFMLIGSLSLLWLLLARGMSQPRRAQNVVLKYDGARFCERSLLAELTALTGVEDVTLISGENVAYLRVDEQRFNESALQSYRSV